MSLKKQLIKEITRSGPITIAEYMTRALYDAEYGYYTQNAEIGRDGDFITAPEISQLFGEMIGIALAQNWMEQSAPTPFTLLELGAGNGTLMADILRATRGIKGFSLAHIALLDINETMQESQKNTLSDYNIHPIKTFDALETLPKQPTFIIANEYFDCLPIHQFRNSEKGWQEIMIDAQKGALGMSLGRVTPLALSGSFKETSPAACAQIAYLSEFICQNGGAILIIDYGEWGSEADTLQALRAHQKESPLHAPGASDLTAHVDFSALKTAAHPLKSGFATQGVFLESLGITERARVLAKNLQGDALKTHIAAHRRLTHPSEMGSLFKVLGLVPHDVPQFIGLKNI